MSKKILFLFIFVFLVISCDKKIKETESKLNNKNILLDKKIQSQKSNKRNFIKTPKKLKSIDFKNLYRPSYGCVDKKYLYIVDASSMLIHKIALYDTNYTVFGKGIGRGPGELTGIRDIQYYKGNIYISDPIKHTIEVYSINEEYVKTIKVNEICPEQIIIDNKGITAYNLYDHNCFFYKYDFNGKFIENFGSPLIMKHIGSGLYHETILCKLSDSSFIQIPKRLGLIGYYENDSLIYIKETIDGIRKEPNDIIYGENYERADREKLFYTCLRVTSNDNFVVMLRFRISKDKKESYFDVYDKKTLDYLYSFETPLKTNGMILLNDTFLTFNNKIIIWEL